PLFRSRIGEAAPKNRTRRGCRRRPDGNGARLSYPRRIEWKALRVRSACGRRHKGPDEESAACCWEDGQKPGGIRRGPAYETQRPETSSVRYREIRATLSYTAALW